MVDNSAVARIHGLLDRYLSVAIDAGLRVESPADPPPDATTVAQALTAAGYVPLDEVVAWFTWPGLGCSESLFWETGEMLSFDRAIEFQAAALAGAWHDPDDPDPPPPEQLFPGPAHWLPLAILDSREFMSADAGPGPGAGRLHHLDSHVLNSFIFESIDEAIETAIYAIEAGLWTSDGRFIECERTKQPSTRDRADPPWAHYHDPPTWRFERVALVAYRLVAISHDREEFLLPHGGDHPAELVDQAPTMRWSDAVGRGTQVFLAKDDYVGRVASGSWRFVRIEIDTEPAWLIADHPSRPHRQQALDQACVARLLEAGLSPDPTWACNHDVMPAIEPALSCTHVEEFLLGERSLEGYSLHE